MLFFSSYISICNNFLSYFITDRDVGSSTPFLTIKFSIPQQNFGGDAFPSGDQWLYGTHSNIQANLASTSVIEPVDVVLLGAFHATNHKTNQVKICGLRPEPSDVQGASQHLRSMRGLAHARQMP